MGAPAIPEVADDPEPGALHDLARQPSGNEANHQYDQETFTQHVHLRILQLHQQADKFPPPQETRDPSSKTGAVESDHSLLQGGLETPSPASKAPCQVRLCKIAHTQEVSGFIHKPT
jgi:hypothetical protein